MARRKLYNMAAIPAAGTTTTSAIPGKGDAAYILAQAKFDWTSGGTSAKVYVQTSLDGGTTWIDIMCLAFAQADATRIMKVMAVASLTNPTTPTDGALADNTVLDGVIGDQLRGKLVVVGTYASTTLDLALEIK